MPAGRHWRRESRNTSQRTCPATFPLRVLYGDRTPDIVPSVTLTACQRVRFRNHPGEDGPALCAATKLWRAEVAAGVLTLRAHRRTDLLNFQLAISPSRGKSRLPAVWGCETLRPHGRARAE